MYRSFDTIPMYHHRCCLEVQKIVGNIYNIFFGNSFLWTQTVWKSKIVFCFHITSFMVPVYHHMFFGKKNHGFLDVKKCDATVGGFFQKSGHWWLLLRQLGGHQQLGGSHPQRPAVLYGNLTTIKMVILSWFNGDFSWSNNGLTNNDGKLNDIIYIYIYLPSAN